MDSCMRAYSTVQLLLCHGSYCELILSLARTSCRLLFTARPTARPLAGNPLRGAVRSRNPSKSTLAHDAVATAVLHKHHPIICVGAGLIQFVYRSHLRLATEATRNRNSFSPFFARVFRTAQRLDEQHKGCHAQNAASIEGPGNVRASGRCHSRGEARPPSALSCCGYCTCKMRPVISRFFLLKYLRNDFGSVSRAHRCSPAFSWRQLTPTRYSSVTK